jgi:hypothetical protein
MKRKKFIKVLTVCCFFTYLCANCSDMNESDDGTSLVELKIKN